MQVDDFLANLGVGFGSSFNSSLLATSFPALENMEPSDVVVGFPPCSIPQQTGVVDSTGADEFSKTIPMNRASSVCQVAGNDRG